MKKLHFFLFLFVATGSLSLYAQSKTVIEDYILQYRDIAMAEMARTGVPASITLAQGIHETGAGTSVLVRKSNNHFGIKCKAEWAGEKVYHDDDARGECFRKYDDPYISYKDHSDFLRNRPHYASLFSLDPEDFEGWAHGLKKAGYATNPKYPQILIKLIRDYNLQDYTLIVLGKKERSENDPAWAGATTNPTAETADFALAKSSDESNAAKPLYPQGVFSINETKVIAIAKGTSYLKIAEEQNISLSRLLEFNDLTNGDVAPEDGLLFLQRKRKTGANETHTVVAGETLYGIAQAEGIRLESLLQYNNLSAHMQVAEGEKLNLQEPASAAPKLASQPLAKAKAKIKTLFSGKNENAEPQMIFHVVQPKETLYGIAKKYEVGVDEVMKWNAMDTTELKIGQQIKINKSL
jgi:LysM repeat protein